MNRLHIFVQYVRNVLGLTVKYAHTRTVVVTSQAPDQYLVISYDGSRRVVLMENGKPGPTARGTDPKNPALRKVLNGTIAKCGHQVTHVHILTELCYACWLRDKIKKDLDAYNSSCNNV